MALVVSAAVAELAEGSREVEARGEAVPQVDSGDSVVVLRAFSPMDVPSGAAARLDGPAASSRALAAGFRVSAALRDDLDSHLAADFRPGGSVA